MQHLVITAFNIFGRNGDDWLIPRMRMFKELCLPSIKSQTEKNFTWVILIDNEIPTIYRDELILITPPGTVLQEVDKESINQTYNGNSGGAVSTLFQPVNHIPRLVGSYLDDDWVTTSILHADDCLAKDYIELISELSTEKREYIAFTVGVQRRFDEWYKAFGVECFALTFVEPTETFESIYGSGTHGRGKEKTLITTEDPMWLWYLHGISQNCSVNSNFKFLGTKEPYSYEEAKGRFGI